MGEIADLMLTGALDFETGEYIGDPCGYPRTVRKLKNGIKRYVPESKFNKYGYEERDWNRMKDSTRNIVLYLCDECGFNSVTQRQTVMDNFMIENKLYMPGTNNLPKNCRKYNIIWENFEEFKKYVKSIS